MQNSGINNPTHTGIIELGVKAHQLMDKVATDMLSLILKYQDKIRNDYILPKVSWL